MSELVDSGVSVKFIDGSIVESEKAKQGGL